jgi:amino acid transporter
MLEFGTSIPRSGGMKVYLERSFSPKLLFTCIYLFYCAILRELEIKPGPCCFLRDR